MRLTTLSTSCALRLAFITIVMDGSAAWSRVRMQCHIRELQAVHLTVCPNSKLMWCLQAADANPFNGRVLEKDVRSCKDHMPAFNSVYRLALQLLLAQLCSRVHQLNEFRMPNYSHDELVQSHIGRRLGLMENLQDCLDSSLEDGIGIPVDICTEPIDRRSGHAPEPSRLSSVVRQCINRTSGH